MKKLPNVLSGIGKVMLLIVIGLLLLKIVFRITFAILGIVFHSRVSFVLTGLALYFGGKMLAKYTKTAPVLKGAKKGAKSDAAA